MPYLQTLSFHLITVCLTVRVLPKIKGLASKENVLPRRWGSETWKFGIKRVNQDPSNTVSPIKLKVST